VAKAAKSNTRLLLRGARDRVTREFHRPSYAEKLLVKWIGGGMLPWGYRAWDGYCRRGMSVEDMIRTFWSKPFQITINWEENYASLLVTLGGARFVLLGVWVSGEVLETLLAATAAPARAAKSSKKRVPPPTERGELKPWVFDQMKNDPNRDDGDYAFRLWQRCGERGPLKTIRNYVSKIRKEFRQEPSKGS
jgi:hypothetical protein